MGLVCEQFYVGLHPANFNCRKNHRQCNLGKWIYDQDQMAELERIDSNLTVLIEKMRLPHDALHKSAVKIEKSFIENSSDHDSSTGTMLSIYKGETLASLKNVKGFFDDIAELL